MESKNARLGLQLFFVYLALYGGFVFINTFSPQTMELTPIAGINLAVLYGFGLIIAALVLALIYGALCTSEDVVTIDTSSTSVTDEAASSQEGAQ